MYQGDRQRQLLSCVTLIWNLLMHVHVCACTYTMYMYCKIFDFSSSGWFAALMMAMLFFRQTQHRSLMGLVTMMCGSMRCHISQNVE